MDRRTMMMAMAASPLLSAGVARAQPGASAETTRGSQRLKLGVMFQVWGFPTPVITDLEQRFSILSRLGYAGVDLLSADQVPLAREHGLEPCLMTAPGGTSQASGAIRATPEQFDATLAGIGMCADVGCPNLLILPGELRGMSREEGRDNLDLVCHIQVAGVPTRGVIDDGQELNYRYIAEQIAESGYDGYVSLEHWFSEDSRSSIRGEFTPLAGSPIWVPDLARTQADRRAGSPIFRTVSQAYRIELHGLYPSLVPIGFGLLCRLSRRRC
jgi:hypothetical protein